MDDIFTPSDTDQAVPENALEALVGEGKKFKDLESLAKGKVQSDNYIKQLERELAEIREANQKAMTLEEVKTAILSQIKPPQTEIVTPPAQPEQQPVAPVNDSDLEAKIAELMAKKEAEAKSTSNRMKVQETLKERFGPDAQMILNQKAKELGVTLDYLAGIANNSPTAFFKLVGLDSTSTPPTPGAPRSTESISPQANSRKAYWDNMKKNNPNEYFSKANTMLRHKEMMRGELPFN